MKDAEEWREHIAQKWGCTQESSAEDIKVIQREAYIAGARVALELLNPCALNED
jgi:hypothetical protein